MHNTLLPVPQGALIVPDLATANREELIALSLVIPTFNERRNIEAMVKLVTTLLDQHLGGSTS